MESFTREIRQHIKKYDAISGSEWKKITNHIIRKYQKIDSQPFNTGFNMIIIEGPSALNTKYGWLCIILDWTNNTRHVLITWTWTKFSVPIIICYLSPASYLVASGSGGIDPIYMHSRMS
jgi:hypothetical protein